MDAEYVFFAVHIFQKIQGHIDDVLQLPIYQSTDKWCLISCSYLHSNSLKPLYMVDSCSSTGAPLQNYPCTLVYCPWSIDYL